MPPTSTPAPLADASLAGALPASGMEAAQRAGDERYRALFDAIDEGFCVLEMIFDADHRPVDYRFLEINPQFERQTGLVGALGKTARELVPSLEQHWFDIYGKVSLTGEPLRFEQASAPMNRWFSVYAFRFGSANSRKVALSFTDITAKKRAEQRAEFLNRLARDLAPAVEEKEIIRIAVTAVGRHLMVDRCFFVECLESANLVVLSENWRRAGTPSLEGELSLYDFGGIEWWHEYSRGDFAVADVETHPLTKDKTANYRAIGVRSYLVQPFRSEGKWTVVFAVTDAAPREWTRDEMRLLEDVVARVWPLVERARATHALRDSEERLRTLADNISQLAWMADAEGSVFWYNRRWFDYTGTTLEEMQSWGWTKVHHPDHVDRVVKRVQHSWDTGELWEDVFPLRSAAGEYRWFLSRARPIRDAEGKILRWFGTNTDITEQRSVEEALRRSEEALRTSRAALEQHAQTLEAHVAERTLKLQETIVELESFSYSISHDLRAPLRAMRSYAGILADECGAQLGQEGRDYLRRIGTAAERMDRLIQDVLVYSRVARDEAPIESIELQSFIASILESYPNISAAEADIELVAPMAAVRANPAALTQCVSNLLGNAVKFVAPGVPPKIRIWTENEAGRTRLFVRDNGIGIAPSDREKIFGIFYQADPRKGGAGIGLSVVRKAAERMGGSIRVESEPENGSTFVLELASAGDG